MGGRRRASGGGAAEHPTSASWTIFTTRCAPLIDSRTFAERALLHRRHEPADDLRLTSASTARPERRAASSRSAWSPAAAPGAAERRGELRRAARTPLIVHERWMSLAETWARRRSPDDLAPAATSGAPAAVSTPSATTRHQLAARGQTRATAAAWRRAELSVSAPRNGARSRPRSSLASRTPSRRISSRWCRARARPAPRGSSSRACLPLPAATACGRSLTMPGGGAVRPDIAATSGTSTFSFRQRTTCAQSVRRTSRRTARAGGPPRRAGLRPARDRTGWGQRTKPSTPESLPSDTGLHLVVERASRLRSRPAATPGGGGSSSSSASSMGRRHGHAARHGTSGPASDTRRPGPPGPASGARQQRVHEGARVHRHEIVGLLPDAQELHR